MKRILKLQQITMTMSLLLLLFACEKEAIHVQEEPLHFQLSEAPEIEATSLPSLSAIDDSMANFMSRFDIPGASIAITRNEKLIYAKGYGYADQATSTPVDTSSLFRIASLSKFVTAVGVMTLIEEGLLDMDDNIFGAAGVLEDDFFTGSTYPTYVEDITVNNLLQHESGGWGLVIRF